MQYVPGKPLDAVIHEGPATVPLVLSIGIQIADGLNAAHQLGIFHRDLKPANVMLTDGGLVKILDFGLARRRTSDEMEFDPAKPVRRKDGVIQATYTARGGTVAYMAPEQFVTGQSSVQSDLFALGVILYELLSGRHPFLRRDADEFQTIRAIQYADPAIVGRSQCQVPKELQSVIFRCLQKTPAERYSSAADVREALKTTMRLLHLDTSLLPADAASTAGMPLQEREKRNAGLLSMLAERFRESGEAQPKQNSILVLPFANFGPTEVAPLYGFALADAVAARLARMPSMIVRPSSSLMQLTTPVQQMDPLAIGQKLLVHYVLAGNFLRSEHGFDLNWQLLDVPGQSVPHRRRHQRSIVRPGRRADRNYQRSLRHAAGNRPRARRAASAPGRTRSASSIDG